MKKILLILIAFLSVNSFAQEKPDWNYDYNQPISAFFPQTLPVFTEKYLVTQNTYYELNWVANNLRRLIEKRLKLRFNDDEQILKEGSSTDVYKSLSGHTIDKLSVKYNIFTYYGTYVVSSVEITGSQASLISFFSYLYNVDLHKLTSKTFSKDFAQDRAVLNLNDNKIVIKNDLFKTISDFKNDFEIRKNKYKVDKLAYDSELEKEKKEYELALIQQKKDYEEYHKNKIEKRKQDSIRDIEIKASMPKESVGMFFYKKVGSIIKFTEEPTDEVLKKLIVEKAKQDKNGNFAVYVKTITIKDEKTYEIKLNKR